MRQVRRNRAVTGTALGVLSLLLATGCSSEDPAVDRDEVGEQSSEVLEEQYGGNIDVACDEDLPAEVGATIRCEVTGTGATYGATVTVTSVDGNDARWDIEVDDEPME
ncbi:DUF4333 domain-containing protein [Streptomyces radicis]|uniref:DUF4333 domain-containing protein n=1 Tax=Streptomyces radicis TaxID=1750517 RepID=A0A3A9VSP3_9ACTN|nr:DUF4333 domain-containing protein [Streptomyces radicis]RKN03770.1 DUF4333 domain-containing protein [Streptomyces radicis]RKN13859.1 DUF4333 domain-containing protein [Streptomyces radicis]